MHRALPVVLLPLVLLVLAACGGPSVKKLHGEHAGKTEAQIRAALGAPETTDSLPSSDETKPRERWFYHKAKLIPGAAAGDFVVVEFEGGAEDSMYEMDAATYKKLNPEGE
jgi:hypothetical protein